jgi:hypothetical protein
MYCDNRRYCGGDKVVSWKPFFLRWPNRRAGVMHHGRFVLLALAWSNKAALLAVVFNWSSFVVSWKAILHTQ